MDIILTQGDLSVTFPVLPETYDVQAAQANTTVNINAIGEVNLLGWPNLDVITWQSFFPHQTESYTTASILSPYEYVDLLSRMKAAGPMDLHLLDMLAIHCTIESLTWGEADGTGDINYSIELKRYIYINREGVSNKYALNGKQGRPSAKPPRSGRNYTTKEGDNLLAIARRELGISAWAEIYAMNKEVIGGDPTIIKPGLVLRLPS